MIISNNLGREGLLGGEKEEEKGNAKKRKIWGDLARKAHILSGNERLWG